MDIDVPNVPEMSPGVARSVVQNTHAHIGVMPSIIKKNTYIQYAHIKFPKKNAAYVLHIFGANMGTLVLIVAMVAIGNPNQKKSTKESTVFMDC